MVTLASKSSAAVEYGEGLSFLGIFGCRHRRSSRLSEVVLRLSFYYVLSVPYVAGFACLGGPYVGGFRLTGWVFAVMLAVAPLVFLADRRPSRFPTWIWGPWLVIVILSLTWADGVDLGSLQDVCQIITPFVIAPIASKAIRTTQDLEALLRAFSHCLLILIIGLFLFKVAGVMVLDRPMAMTAAIAGCVFISQFQKRRVVAVLGWGGCLLVAGLTGSRMATLALLLELIFLPGIRRHTHRVFIAATIAALSVALFYTPVFQERFFPEGQGTLSDVTKGEFSSTGRFEVWAELLKEVAQRPLLGAGAHSSSAVVERIWGFGIVQPHNDYLRILLEQGVIGLSFFLLGVVGQLISLWNRRYKKGDQRAVFRSAAYLGILVFLIMALTDNPIIYGVWFMHPLFVLLGVSYTRSPEALKVKEH